MYKILLPIFFLALSIPLFGQWNVYLADSIPTESTPSFSGSCNEPGADFSATIVPDTEFPGNNLLQYFSPDVEGKQAYKVNPDPWTGFTAVVRMKALPDIDTLDRLFDIEIRNGDSGLREKIFIKYSNTIELDNADTSATVDVQQWHIYRITMSGDTVSVYLDEDSSPILTGITSNSTSSYELKIGDCSGSGSQGALVDWFTWTGDGAFAPGTGPALPGDLFPPAWNVYAADALPRASSPSFSGSCNEPGPDFSEMIIEDPEIPGNNLLQYFSPDVDSKQAYKVNPDPWTGFTAMVRMKAYPGVDTLDRLFDIEIRNGDSGVREKVYVYSDNRIELDNADTTATVDVQQWHIYRITMEGDSLNVYIDEDSTPVLTGITTNSTSSYELKIADCSGASQGALVDWFTWTGDGAFAPGTGPSIPDSLFTETTIVEWAVYPADSLPTQSSPSFSGSCNEPGADFSASIIEDPDIAGNNLLEYFSPDVDGKQAYKVVPDPWTGFTLAMRMKAFPGVDTLDRLFDIEIRNGDSGLREKFFVYSDNRVELDNADTSATVDVQGWHIYRITMNEGNVSVYMDEDATPILTGVTTNSTSSYEVKIADCSGASQGAIVDWISWTGGGAFAPGTGPSLPDSLSTDFMISNTLTVEASKIELNAFPNPFEETTNFSFNLEEAGNVNLTIYDLMGRHIQTIINGQLPSGIHQIPFSTAHLQNGFYIYRFESNGVVIANKIIKGSR